MLSSTGAPSEITIKIFLCSCLGNNLLNDHKSASPSIFSFSSPSLSITPKFFLERLKGSSADLKIICLRSFNRPGLALLPWLIHNFLASPPFQCFVVNPRISVLILHLSRVLPMISPQIAARVIDLPRIEPELSIKSVTTVSLNSFSDSSLKLNGEPGFVITLDNLAVSRMPSSRLKLHSLFCCAMSSL